MSACTPASGAAAPAALDLHEGISTPRASTCARWPERLRLRSSSGKLVRGRCRATNLCDYCARLAAVETSEALALDALDGNAPAVWIVLTTRTASLDPSRFYRSREKVWRAVKRRWPDAEYAALVEFTTGYGPRSGGLRRPHWNLLVKGVPAADVADLERVVLDVWCSREDAEAQSQFVGVVDEVGGLMRYVALHFLKESQAPPKGWRGHRFTHSRGYFVRSVAELRAEARRSLRLKRWIWKLGDAELAAIALELAEAESWELVAVRARELLDRETGELRTASVVEVVGPVERIPRPNESERLAPFRAEGNDRIAAPALGIEVAAGGRRAARGLSTAAPAPANLVHAD